MRIGIDARFLGPEGTGLGRYTEKLLEKLQELDDGNEYVVILRKKNFNYFVVTNTHFSKFIVDAPHYSFLEQILMPFYLYRLKLDVVHFCHFNVPIFYFGKFVVTIHDMIKHEYWGKESTTRPTPVYLLKHWVYLLVFRLAVKRAVEIITPSNFVKEKIVAYFKVEPSKVKVTYEAGDEKVFTREVGLGNEIAVFDKYKIKEPFVIYVGNVYPYKNIERLIKVVKKINDDGQKLYLVLVGARDAFMERLKKVIGDYSAEKIVVTAGYIPDRELSILYHNALAYVFPSFSEGFGIPGVEAMMSGLPVVCSNKGSLTEVYNGAAYYFDPSNESEMGEAIKKVINDGNLREKLRTCGFELAKRYSWSNLAKETLEVYREACDRS